LTARRPSSTGWKKIGLQAGRETKMMPPAGFTTDVFAQPHVVEAAAFGKTDKDRYR
jgi:hypothetical protein